MAHSRVRWTVRQRHIEPHTDKVSAIGLLVTYQDRESDINIVLAHPLDGKTPENEASLSEMRRLRDALNDILGEP